MKPRRAPEGPAGCACALSDSDASERQRWIASVMARATHVSVEPHGLTARFHPEAALERELRSIAAAEGECCPFLRIEVTRGDGRLRFAVAGPPEARRIIELMFESARGR